MRAIAYFVLSLVMMLIVATAMQPSANSVYAADGAAGDPVVNSSNDCSNQNLNKQTCGIVEYIVIFTRALTALAGTVIVLGIVIGGFQYMTAGSNPQAVSKAKSRIMNALLALAVLIFMFSFLQWLVPGGVI